MTPSAMTQNDQDLLGRCLRAAAHGPFFPDWEFHSLFGLERAEVAAIAARWPKVDAAEKDVRLAIHNALGNLLGYPHDEGEAFRKWIGEPFEEVERVFKKWCDTCE
jgi:hypothetical protein